MPKAAEARLIAVKHISPTHVTTSKSSNKHGDSRSKETEPVSTLDRKIAPRPFLLIQNRSLYLERVALHLSLHPHRSFRLTYRNHIARRSKSRVYAKVDCRRCGERSGEERQPYLDPSATPVRPLFPQYIHSPVDVRI